METERLFDDDDDEGGESWLASYSDLVTDLMAIFVLLFSWAMISQSYTSQASNNTNSAGAADKTAISSEANSSSVSDTINTDDGTSLEGYQNVDDEFDQIYLTIKEKIEESGYSDSIIIEKSTEYIKFRFNDNVLFYPDSPAMRETSFDILKYMGDLLYSVDDLIMSIEIGGHTATTGEKTSSFFSWELSSGRAIAVLKFFVNTCSLPESKMVVSGYSKYQPVASNDTEETRAQNRRVEVKITRVGKTNN